MKQTIQTEIKGHVTIKDRKTGEILLDKDNAINTINMARVLARGLAHETNNWIESCALGNGGTYTDAAGQLVLRSPNVDSWDARLYNQTYSEVVDESSAYFETGNGAVPASDPSGGGVVSQEVGSKSNIIITLFLNENEPTGQLDTDSGSSLSGEELDFKFDEIGLFSYGKPPQATNGVSSIDVNDRVSTDEISLAVSTVYTMTTVVDGTTYTTEITTPAGGTGVSGVLTFGDFCEGINNGTWISSGNLINNYLYVYITDRSGGEYPTIIGKESYGFLTFESKTTGALSSVSLTCDSDTSNIFNAITGAVCGNVNVNQVNGVNAGVQNDPTTPANERERLLTHMIFDPLLKTKNRAIEILYTLTISVSQSQDSTVTVS